MVRTNLGDRWELLAPVFPGDTLQVRHRAVALRRTRSRPTQGVLTYQSGGNTITVDPANPPAALTAAEAASVRIYGEAASQQEGDTLIEIENLRGSDPALDDREDREQRELLSELLLCLLEWQ